MPRGSRWGPRGLGQYLRPNRVAPAVFPKQAQIPFTVFGMAEPESLVPGESRTDGGGWPGGREGPRAGGRPGPASRPALAECRPQSEPWLEGSSYLATANKEPCWDREEGTGNEGRGSLRF